MEGELTHQETAARLAQKNIPRCAPEDKVADVRARVTPAQPRLCAVIDRAGTVEGLVAQELWQADGALAVEQIMDPAPLTVRPHTLVKVAGERMRKQQRDTALVTTPDGHLLGVLRQK